jgi:hypothetical protein
VTHFESMAEVKVDPPKTARKGDPIISEDGTAILAYFATDITMSHGALELGMAVPIRPYSDAFFSGEHEIIRAWIEPVFYRPALRVWRLSMNPSRTFESADDPMLQRMFSNREMFALNNDRDRMADAIDLVLTSNAAASIMRMGGISAPDHMRDYAKHLRRQY